MLDEIVDVEATPLDEPPVEEGDDAAAHEATNGAVDEAEAPEAATEQKDLRPQDDIELAAADVDIAKVRIRIVRAAMLGHKDADQVHYTTGPRRWDGITNRRRAHMGRFPRWADCSSYVTWCLWDALGGPDAGADIVNGQSWKGGFTGTMKQNGRRVPGGLVKALAGDLVLYGGGAGKHVAIVVGKNRVVSHGSESGPVLLEPDYRSDLAEVRRYIG